MKIAAWFLLTLFLPLSVLAKGPHPESPRANPAQPAPAHPHQPDRQSSPHAAANPPAAETVDEKPVITHHKITVGGKVLEYTATAAQMPIRDDNGSTEAHIFYMAYTLDGVSDNAKRPLTFAFNGGPGSASIWLHMGALGPRRVKMVDPGVMPPPPFQLVDNEFTWLDQTDLVFIDPVGTGYSRAKSPEIARKLNGVEGDFQSVSEFIRMYLVRNDRWLSPLFVAGESYGTFRAAGLASTLIDNGIALNGVVMISTVLDMSVLEQRLTDSLPYALHLPTCTADAWYHKKLPPDLLKKDLPSVLKEVEPWAMTDYLDALNQGSGLAPARRKAIVEKLARYTGLEPKYVDRSELLIDSGRFTRELLRDEKLTIGSYDGRLTGPAPLNAGDWGETDPSLSLVRPPFETGFLHYVQAELGYKTDMEYYVLGRTMPWNWNASNEYADATHLLRNAMTKNPHLKVLLCSGYYDLVTPYFSVEYTLNHLGLHPEMQKNIRLRLYKAGHMMYIDRESNRKLKRDVTDFIGSALPQR